MKIAVIPSTFLPWIGGAEIQTHNTANKMAELGNDVDIYLLEKNRTSEKKKKTTNHYIEYLNNKKSYNKELK